jgi:hypothetical protein
LHDKEIDMTTSKPVELGTASKETKHPGLFQPDSVLVSVGDKIL